MKIKIPLYTLFFLLVFCQRAFGFTGLVLPFYNETPLDLSVYEKLLDDKEYERASLELSIFIILNSGAKNIGRASTLLGMALYKQGKGRQAAQAFELSTEMDKELSDIAAIYRIRSLELAGEPELVVKAIDEFHNKYGTSYYTNDHGEIRAKSLSELNRHKEAGEAFLSLAGTSTNSSHYSKYRVKAAKSFLKSNDLDKAKRVVTEILFETEPNRHTKAALDLYFKLFKRAGPRLSAEVANWYKERHYRYCAPVFKDILKQMTLGKSAPGEIYEIRTRYAYSLYRIHANKESLLEYDLLINDAAGADRPHSLFRKAKLLTRMGDNKASRAVFQKLLKEHPNSGYTNAARYQLALINMEDNKYEKAYNYFKWRITKPGGNQEYLTWLAAWCAFRKGYYDSAGKYLDALLKKNFRSRQRDRYRYWRARVHSVKKENKQAIKIYKSINSAGPLTYYGMKSYEELAKRKIWGRSLKGVLKNSKGKPPVPELTSKYFDTSNKFLFNKAKSMSRAGMEKEAEKAVTLLVPNYEDEKFILYGLARLYQENGAHNKALRLARNSSLFSYCKSNSRAIGPCYFTFSYPKGFSDIVEKYARKRNLSPAVVYALIHQESTYRPWVVSPAHAVGLMQIIPKTGVEIANDLNFANYSNDLLYDPEININFGTHYMAKVFKKFGGKLPSALASYNAGPDVVGKWMRNKGHLPDEIFIEEIPYRETNNYVKKIITKIEIYKGLYELK